MELKYIVYITINLCNGKFYIGVHKTNPKVFDGYIGLGVYRQSLAKGDYPFHKAVRKYGYENFKRTTLVTFPDTEEGYDAAYALETVLVNETLLKSKQCYNVALGGKGSPLELDYKTIYMFDLKGNYLRSFKGARQAALYLNTEDTFSTLKAIRNNCLGKTNSSFGYYWSYIKEFNYSKNKVERPVAQYTLSGKFLRTFDSISEAEREMQISTIYQAIVKKFNAAGFQWKYYEGDSSDISPLLNVKNRNKLIPIIMYDSKSMNIVKEFNCVNDCVKEYPELSKSQINRVLNKVIKSHKGYFFKFKDEDIVQTIQETN